MSRRARLAAGLLLMTSTVGALSAVAGGQIGGPAAGTAEAPAPDRLVVTDQDDWVAARGEFQLTVQVDAPDDDSVVQARIYPPVEDPAAVRAGTLPARSLRRAALEELQAGRQTVTLRMAVVPDADGTPGDPLVLDPGVYPLRVQLLDGDGNSVDEVVTHLVHLAPEAPAAERRPLALVVPLHAPPARDQTGRSVLPADTVAELDRRLATLAAYPEVPVAVRATPETVNALAERQDGTSAAALARLRDLTAGPSESLAGTFVRMDANAWFGGGFTDLLANELDLGRETLVGAQLDPAGGTVALDRAPSASLTAWLGQRGVTRIVLPPGTASLPDAGGSAPAAPTTATPRPTAPAPLDGRPSMAVTVPLSLPSGDQVPDGLAAHRELAALAADAIAEPAGPVQVVEVAAAPASDPAFLRAILEAVSRGGPFQPIALSTAFDRAAASPPPPGALPDAPPAPLGDLATTYLAGVNLLSSLIAMVGPQDPAIAPLQTRLLLVPAIDGPAAAPGQLVEDIHAAARAATIGLQLPTSGTIVVTSHDARLPLVLRNQSDRTMRVALQLTSSELEFTGPNPLQLTLPPGPTDIEIPIHTRRSGEFEVDIRATSPDGGLSLAETRLTVQSRAISGVGVLLSAGALMFLVIWWVRNYRNRARRRPAPLTPEPVADPVTANPDRTTVTAGPVP